MFANVRTKCQSIRDNFCNSKNYYEAVQGNESHASVKSHYYHYALITEALLARLDQGKDTSFKTRQGRRQIGG